MHRSTKSFKYPRILNVKVECTIFTLSVVYGVISASKYLSKNYKMVVLSFQALCQNLKKRLLDLYLNCNQQSKNGLNGTISIYYMAKILVRSDCFLSDLDHHLMLAARPQFDIFRTDLTLSQ